MSDLQISLLVIGAVVVMGVYMFNRWQEYKLKRRTNEAFNAGHGDALLEGQYVPTADERIEPSLGRANVQSEEEAQPDFDQEEIANEAPYKLEVPAYLEEDQTAGSIPPNDLDPAIEFIAHLHPGEPVAASALAEVMAQLAGFGKPVRWVGLNAQTHTWEAIVPERDASFIELAAGLQLADRSGPLSETQLAAFCDAIQTFASQQLAVIDWPDKQAALLDAADLDKFCLDVDVLIGLNVVVQGGAVFPATKIRSLAESSGMTLEPEGVFHFRNERGTSLYSLCNHESSPFNPDNIKNLSTHGVTLLFDVPRVPDGLRVFDQMTALGRKLSNSLGGILVDDNIRPLTDAGIDKIRQQLGTIYQKMEEKRIGAGSSRALTLFS
jgi:FtsZ-interacting cell division protein ZipA